MAMTEHRVATHLGLAASDYDAEIRRYIPTYEEMIGTVVAIVGTIEAPYVLDLGAGTGALGAAILDRIPRARVQFLACPCREITLEQVVVFQVPGVNDHDLPPRNPRSLRTARNRCTRTVDSLMPVIALTSRGEQSP